MYEINIGKYPANMKASLPYPHQMSTQAPATELEDRYQNISRKVEAILENFERLSKFTNEAINKCHPFLVNDPRNAVEEGATLPTPSMSPHAHALDNLNDKLWDLGTLVRNFTSSIDS
jgi:hypothetical protein